MKKTKVASLMLFGLIATIFVLESCDKEAHDITMSGGSEPGGSGFSGTALDYAYACEAVLGTLPEFKYEDAIEVPITKNGVHLTQSSENANDCDHPFAFNTPCDPGNRVGRYQGLNPDGTENSDVVFIALFRGSGVGVIGYRFSTGETCFFEIDDFGDFNSGPLPEPGDVNYNDFWGSPAQISQEFNCTSCHMATPFLHTPAVDQLRNPADTSELLVPLTGLGPYTMVAEAWQAPPMNNIQNSCTSCHRPACTQHFENYPLDELTMPAPFQNATDFDHSTISNADREAIRNWCNSLNLPQFN
ncbi:MAG: hypothetical protein ACO3M5_00190 [Saprospiraceae bacterium]|jgi:hypothetical protein